MVMGTFGYMSPEQVTGATVDERSDLFSIGVMVVEALTGRRPFRGNTYQQLLTSILQGAFHLQGGSGEAQRLDEVLQRCLAKDRKHRFSSAAEMQKELIPALRNCPVLSTEATVLKTPFFGLEELRGTGFIFCLVVQPASTVSPCRLGTRRFLAGRCLGTISDTVPPVAGVAVCRSRQAGGEIGVRSGWSASV
jgi:serine/threonine protein kinase